MLAAFAAGAVVVVLVAIIAGLWNRTSTPATLDTEAIARSIELTLLTQRHLASTVSCPIDIDRQAGLVFDCTATVKQNRYPVIVTETDGNGHVTYVVR